MKKLIFGCAAIAALSLVSCSSKDRFKAKYDKDCKEMLGKQPSLSADMKKAYEDYCDCSGDKLVSKFSEKELEEMDKQQKTMDPAKQQELQMKISPVIMPCATELQKKMVSSMPAGAAPTR